MEWWGDQAALRWRQPDRARRPRCSRTYPLNVVRLRRTAHDRNRGTFGIRPGRRSISYRRTCAPRPTPALLPLQLIAMEPVTEEKSLFGARVPGQRRTSAAPCITAASATSSCSRSALSSRGPAICHGSNACGSEGFRTTGSDRVLSSIVMPWASISLCPAQRPQRESRLQTHRPHVPVSLECQAGKTRPPIAFGYLDRGDGQHGGGDLVKAKNVFPVPSIRLSQAICRGLGENRRSGERGRSRTAGMSNVALGTSATTSEEMQLIAGATPAPPVLNR